jgi:hypothetical protein
MSGALQFGLIHFTTDFQLKPFEYFDTEKWGYGAQLSTLDHRRKNDRSPRARLSPHRYKNLQMSKNKFNKNQFILSYLYVQKMTMV